MQVGPIGSGAATPGAIDRRFLEPSRLTQFRRRCFSSTGNAITTIVAFFAIGYAVIATCRWAVLDAVFVAQGPDACRATTGACWATVYYHARVIFFGLYPSPEQWRAVLAIACFLAAVGLCASGLLRSLRLLLVLGAATWGGFVVLMRGGVFGLSPIPQDQWGGLPLTIHVFLAAVVIGFPLAVVLSLGREAELPSIRWVCAGLVEVVRAVPLLTILFCAAVVTPLMIPGVLTPGKLTRIMLALALYYGCYQAEVIRGGVRTVTRVEIEGARALGLSHFQTTMLVVLPQAIRVTIPATANLIVVAFKDTSLIVIVGLFDFIASANTAIASDVWAPYFGEIYIMVALTFLVIAGALSWLGRVAEQRLALNR